MHRDWTPIQDDQAEKEACGPGADISF